MYECKFLIVWNTTVFKRLDICLWKGPAPRPSFGFRVRSWGLSSWGWSYYLKVFTRYRSTMLASRTHCLSLLSSHPVQGRGRTAAKNSLSLSTKKWLLCQKQGIAGIHTKRQEKVEAVVRNNPDCWPGQTAEVHYLCESHVINLARESLSIKAEELYTGNGREAHTGMVFPPIILTIRQWSPRKRKLHWVRSSFHSLAFKGNLASGWREV